MSRFFKTFFIKANNFDDLKNKVDLIINKNDNNDYYEKMLKDAFCFDENNIFADIAELDYTCKFLQLINEFIDFYIEKDECNNFIVNKVKLLLNLKDEEICNMNDLELERYICNKNFENQMYIFSIECGLKNNNKKININLTDDELNKKYDWLYVYTDEYFDYEEPIVEEDLSEYVCS